MDDVEEVLTCMLPTIFLFHDLTTLAGFTASFPVPLFANPLPLPPLEERIIGIT